MSYPNDQSQAAGGIPVYLEFGGVTVSSANPLPVTGGSASTGHSRSGPQCAACTHADTGRPLTR